MKPTITGYRAENSITVQTGALDLVGPLIDAAIAAGANRVNSLDFNLRDDTRARNDAITKAAKDAQAAPSCFAAPASGAPLMDTLEEIEKYYIQQALSNLSGNLTQTSKTLGISLSTLKRKIKEYGLK